MRRTLIALVLLAMPWHVHGQGTPEEAAIAEVLSAKDYASIEKHLPKALSDALETVDKSTRAQFLSRARSTMETKSLKIAQANDGRALLAFDVESAEADVKHFELIARRRISDGMEAVLVIECVAPEKSWGEAEVWMRFEDGEWRINEFDNPDSSQRVHLDDPTLVDYLLHKAQYDNEMAAVGVLQRMVFRIAYYNAEFSEVPQRLEMLGTAPDGQTSPEHAGIPGPELSSTRERSGYRFSYERTSVDSYAITASPIEFGRSGTRNFFADESGIIRFTTEDRAATANDPPFEPSSYWNDQQ
jgi:hypothetical protein